MLLQYLVILVLVYLMVWGAAVLVPKLKSPTAKTVGAGFLSVSALMWLIVAAPIWLPLHFLLRLFGRRGFLIYDGNSVGAEVGYMGFRKAAK